MDAPSDILNGWKEIAAYLGRSPRSVQRWEQQLGLPVRRIPTSDGGAAVYALRSELDTWRVRPQTKEAAAAEADGGWLEPDPGEVGDTATVTDGAAPQLAPPAPAFRLTRILTRPVPLWTLPGVAAVVAVAVATIGVLVREPALTGAAATWEFDGRLVHAFSEGGRRLWSHEFDRVVSRPNTFVRDNGASLTLDGEASTLSLIPVRFAARRDSTADSDAVVAFNGDGSVRWSVQPTTRLTVGSETFDGPWYVFDIASGRTAAGPRTWIAFGHHTWWPSFVLEVDTDGRHQFRYVQSGRVHSLTYWEIGGRRLLVAGGTLDDVDRASAAFVDLDRDAARWPAAGQGALECAGCPAGTLGAMLTFPTSEVTRRMARPYGRVFRGRLVPSGLTLLINDGFGQGTMATVSPELTVTMVERSDQYWHMHQELERQERITHPASECPELAEPLAIGRWTPEAGWATTPVPLRQPDARGSLAQ